MALKILRRGDQVGLRREQAKLFAQTDEVILVMNAAKRCDVRCQQCGLGRLPRPKRAKMQNLFAGWKDMSDPALINEGVQRFCGALRVLAKGRDLDIGDIQLIGGGQRMLEVINQNHSMSRLA